MRRLACSLLLISGTAAADNVLVWHDAALRTAPADDAAALHVATLDGPRAERVGHVVPMHLVAMRGDYAEVELAGDAGCTWTKLATNDDVGKLHLFVAKADLAPVLAKPFDKTFADGTRISLRPGVAVVPTTAGRYVLAVHGRTLEVELPGASVATHYVPDKAKPAALTVHDVVLADGALPTLGGQPVALGGLRTAGVDKHGDTALASLDERCVALTVSVATKSLRTTDDDDDDTIDGGSGFGVLDLRELDYVPALTPLSTTDGHQLAYAAKPIYLASAPHGKLACFDRKLRLESTLPGAPAIADADDRLRLCAPASKVVHERIRTASSANGSATR
ncbi:MAG: hypothetical protein ACM31C_16455 [Acidobacteriota bacterium]